MLLRRVNARELCPLAAARGSEGAGPWAEPFGMAGGSPRFLQALRAGDRPEPVRTRVQEQDLQEWGLTGIRLRSYQLEGVNWLVQCFHGQNGCILGDEMGLGKTCQTIALLIYLVGRLNDEGPFLILCPLSVLSNWKEEMERFAPGLSCVTYTGDKEERARRQQDLRQESGFHVLLTTYEICLKDASFLKSFSWSVLAVDEAHRLKNQSSLLHRTLSEFSVVFRLLLTGTPIQNSLQELYSLLSVVEPDLFCREQVEDFVQCYQDIEKESKSASELHRLLRPFLLRRVKAQVATELPKKTEVVIYHGMSALQKKYYKAILMKDLDAFENETAKKVKLQNVLTQLRKCVDHPYLFDGVEPEPFEVGEHLIEASGKLHLLDRLLAFLYSGGHRVLLFSQMTHMLDILQDYMDYRGYSYERVDGSVRGEERHLAIKNFGKQPIFVFLLSTRAGGVGMNLTAADTVIFVDSDFNPQNDLQAAARAHRIGQNKSVKVIRLIGRDTVEEIVYRKAASKLQLTNMVIEGGHFTLGAQKPAAEADLQLSEILKFGLDKLLSSEGSSMDEIDLKSILGETKDGQWTPDALPAAAEGESREQEEGKNHMYLFEGRDYSKEPSKEDRKSFEQLVNLQKTLLEKTSHGGRSLRNKGSVLIPGLAEGPIKRKKILSPEELEDRQKKRQEAAAKRKKLMEEKKKAKEEAEHRKKMAWWESNGYQSFCLPSEDSELEDLEDLEDGDETSAELDYEDLDLTSINYVSGDVTHPQAGEEDAVIVHCVDDSGRWGRGGLFTALEARSAEPRKIYELAGKMKDLSLGDVLLFPIDDKESRDKGQDLLALVVAQHRDRTNVLSGIKMAALEEGLKKILLAAKKKKASVHLPRIGHATKGFNWYGTERLIRKHLATRGIPTFIYYFPRSKAAACHSQPASPTSAPLVP
ncbi:chromodomain-helicase-DNA-binding protein 1-like isoform X2 [Rattus norvegicus]|uniref:Chromodomain helicase DNA binding protein 1-like n=5 Tax=Rattus norvegicus TaxID=10116 RepID=A0A8I5ZYW5_RAT|nr:chromodomain-helicase-DNA-binding protein 1-like isoform X1 [Rattus norvegicus]|eukprot:XP_006233080.1 PREDICTED: chromodomain-helicase-DNA-binding protein 1-like isoform X1 [Rattus norvegicus]